MITVFIISPRQGSSLSYLYGDHLGSTSLVTDAAGATLAETRYQPYGQPYWQWGATRTDFGFTGQRLDGFGLMDYNARYYSSTLGRFISPDSIVPSVGEGNNSNAIGYVNYANFSSLVVDYHENQFLAQLNQENRIRLENPNRKLPSVPNHSLAFDRYGYAFNNPIRYNDPSGHCPACAVAGLTLLGISPLGWVLIGLAVTTALVFSIPEVRQAAAHTMTNFMESLSDGVSQIRTDPKPWGLTNEQQEKLWGDAIEALKEGRELPNGYTVSKDIMQKVTDMILAGATSAEAIADALADEIEEEIAKQKPPRSGPRHRNNRGEEDDE